MILKGGSVSRATAVSVLWENRDYDRSMQKLIIRSLSLPLRQRRSMPVARGNQVFPKKSNEKESNNMKQKMIGVRLIAVALSLVMLLALTACGAQSASAQKIGKDAAPSETLKGIFDALIAPDSDYSQNKAMMAEYYPELEYSETLGTDRITLTFKANGNEYYTDGAWDFVQDGDRLTAVIANDDYSGIFNVMNMAEAIGACFGMDTDVISGYLNGLSIFEIESDNFKMTQNESDGTMTYSLNIAGPWDMKELDQMVLNETVLDDEPLGENFISQGGSVGKMQYLANGNADSYTALFAESGELDDVAYQSIVNLITLRKPAGWENFLADFTELKALETDDYAVILNPDDEAIAQIMGERNEKRSYVLVRFGAEEYDGYYEEEYEVFVPDAEAFADFYFREVANVPRGTAGTSLAMAQAAFNVLSFADYSDLRLMDIATLRANMSEAWDSLTDDEQAGFNGNFMAMNALLYSCFEDWNANRSAFEDAGVADGMEYLLSFETAYESWDTLSAHTWTLGNSDDE